MHLRGWLHKEQRREARRAKFAVDVRCVSGLRFAGKHEDDAVAIATAARLKRYEASRLYPPRDWMAMFRDDIRDRSEISQDGRVWIGGEFRILCCHLEMVDDLCATDRPELASASTHGMADRCEHHAQRNDPSPQLPPWREIAGVDHETLALAYGAWYGPGARDAAFIAGAVAAYRQQFADWIASRAGGGLWDFDEAARCKRGEPSRPMTPTAIELALDEVLNEMSNEKSD